MHFLDKTFDKMYEIPENSWMTLFVLTKMTNWKEWCKASQDLKLGVKKNFFNTCLVSNSEYDVLLSQEFNLKFKTSFWVLTYE